MQEQVDIQQVISSREYSWYDKIRVEDWLNRAQVVKHDVSSYNIVMLIKQKSDVKPNESNCGETSGIIKFVEQHNTSLSWHFIIITRPTNISRYVSWCTSQHTYIHI